MISFYPGPSRVDDRLPAFVRDAHRLGILSMNHRSPEFMALCKKTVGLLRKKIGLPATYPVFFTSSATECWEIIAQSVVEVRSVHVFNGAFGEKWFDYTRRLRPEARAVVFGRDEEFSPSLLAGTAEEVICITQNETSNGTQLANTVIRTVKKNHPGCLVAVDATSSMAGIRLDYTAGDIWFASVQKCFGLPAGLAVMAVSPVAMKRISAIGEKKHYNSMVLMDEMMAKWQTPYTPNVLALYLLLRTLENRSPMSAVHKKTKQRFEAWQKFFHASAKMELLVRRPAARSYTVIAVKGDPGHLADVKLEARKKGFLLGEGYGSLRDETFRIANFPALKDTEIRSLMRFLSRHV
jgi:phosphoserine aminotransferase